MSLEVSSGMNEILRIALIIVCMLPSVWFFQLAIHELGHLLFAWVFCGYPSKSVRFYPIRWGDFAKCEWDESEPIRPTIFDKILSRIYDVKMRIYYHRIIYASPFIIGIVLSLVWGCLMLVSFYFLPLLIVGVGDVLFFLYGMIFGSDKSDGKRFLAGKPLRIYYGGD